MVKEVLIFPAQACSDDMSVRFNSSSVGIETMW
jgi:hypothetical protein